MSAFACGPLIAIATSRLRRLVIPDEPWVLGLRGTLRHIAAEGGEILVAPGVAVTQFVQQAAARMKIPVHVAEVTADHDRSDHIPACDRALIEAADLVYVLSLRPHGNIHRLLRERLAQGRGGIVLVDLPGLQADSIRSELVGQRAVTWRPTNDQCRPLEQRGVDQVETCPEFHAARNGVYSIYPFSIEESDQFLVHTTRACAGPWPDESFEEYADSLMESRSEADHSALGTLRRIARHQKLAASNRSIRGGSRVVSFTACPLHRLPALHCFRSHRVRWDFEPFGLCLRREWLTNRGVRPVKYGDDAVWNSLTAEEQPFFQIAIGKSGIDWRVEEEWRGLGDLNLADLTPDDVRLFVPDFTAAKSLAEVTPWPITLWTGTTAT